MAECSPSLLQRGIRLGGSPSELSSCQRGALHDSLHASAARLNTEFGPERLSFCIKHICMHAHARTVLHSAGRLYIIWLRA